MVALPIPRSSTPGSRAGEGEGRLVNCYSVREGDRDYVRRCPGLANVFATPGSGFRGMIEANFAFYFVFADMVVYVSYPGPTVTVLAGAIPGSDPVTLAINNRTTAGVPTPDVVAVRRDGGAYVLTPTAVGAYPDADLPASVNSVAFLDGYFLFTVPDGRIFASELNSTDIGALSFATAESRPDGLLRGIVSGALFYAMGGSTIEPWQNVGTSPFPLQRAQTILPTGVRGTMAAAGDGAGWDHGPFFVASDGSVRALDGYTDAVISTPDVERFIAASAPTELDMMVHIARGRPFVTVSSSIGSWSYDVRGQAWHERLSAGLTRWRAGGSMFTASGAWLFGDRLSGNVLTPSSDFLEVGAGVLWMVESGALKQFPAGTTSPDLFVDVSEVDGAFLGISWSINGGKTWSTPAAQSMAETDLYPVRVNGLGQSTHHGLRARFTCTNNVDFSFMGASVPDPQIRAQAAT